MSIPLSTPPTRLAIGNDGWFAREKLADSIGNLNTGVQVLQRTTANLANGVTGTISLAPLTSGGTAGSITVTGGVITAFTNPT